jgi:type IV pilus assembly protein PilM
MRLPFLDSGFGQKRDQVIAVDLGSRTSKAVCLQRRGQGLALCGFALLDAPIYEKTLSADLLTEHLKAVMQALNPPTKYLTLAVGVNDAPVRHADIPRIPVREMRMVLKLNPKTYLQQDLPGYVFDCQVSKHAPNSKAAEAHKTQDGTNGKQKVLVAGARQQLVDDFVHGAKGAGLIPDCIVPGLIGPVNAFERAMPDLFAKEAVAIVDLGFKNTSICILQEGELILSRVVNIGGDRLTNGLAESLSISYAEADGIKVGMPAEVQAPLESLLLPLGRELRASMDFFEHQQDCPVGHVFITGGAARSEFIVQRLKQELMVDCQILNPTSFLEMQLPPPQAAEIEQIASQLAVAVGAALASL